MDGVSFIFFLFRIFCLFLQGFLQSLALPGILLLLHSRLGFIDRTLPELFLGPSVESIQFLPVLGIRNLSDEIQIVVNKHQIPLLLLAKDAEFRVLVG